MRHLSSNGGRIVARAQPRPGHRVPRPLPEPPRTRHVSRIARRPLDRLGQLLEEWMAELRMGYTHAGD